MQSCTTLWQIFTHQLCEVTRILWLTLSLARSQRSQLSWTVRVSIICRLPNVFTIGIFRQRMPLKSAKVKIFVVRHNVFSFWAHSFGFASSFFTRIWNDGGGLWISSTCEQNWCDVTGITIEMFGYVPFVCLFSFVDLLLSINTSMPIWMRGIGMNEDKVPKHYHY